MRRRWLALVLFIDRDGDRTYLDTYEAEFRQGKRMSAHTA